MAHISVENGGVEIMKHSPRLKRICSPKTGRKLIQDHPTGTLKKSQAIGKKTTIAKRNRAKLNSTVATGKTSIGSATFLIKLPLSRVEPVDIISDWAKKFHGRIPTIRK